jgi:hypothetical protein
MDDAGSVSGDDDDDDDDDRAVRLTTLLLLLLILAPGSVIRAAAVKLIFIKCCKQKRIKGWKIGFIFNIRATCLVRVIITSLLYLTHHPANLLYELGS